MPRPMRLRARRFCAGFRFERLSSSATRSVLHAVHGDEMPHLSEHTRDLTRILVLGGAPDPAEPERAQGAAVALGLADLAAYLPDDELRHQLSSFSDPAA